MASNDESSSDDENNSFFSKEMIVRSDDYVPCCTSCGRTLEKCSCRMSNNLNHNGQETKTTVVENNSPTTLTNGQIKTEILESNHVTSKASFSDSDLLVNNRLPSDLAMMENLVEEQVWKMRQSEYLTNFKEELKENSDFDNHNNLSEVNQNSHIKNESNNYKSVSDNGCDQSCNIGAVNITIDTNNGSLNQEISKNSGLQINSNVNNNDIDILNNFTYTNDSNKLKPKKKICSKLVSNLDYNMLKGKQGIDLLTAIEEQTNINFKIFDFHCSSESGTTSNTDLACSPRNARTRSVETATCPKRNAKRALSADADHKDVKLRRLDLRKAKSIITTKIEHKDDKSKSRRHESTKKYEKRRGSSSRKKSVGTQTRSHKDLSINPTLMTNGNYSYPPADTSLKYRRFYHIETHSNGGAKILRMYDDELKQLRYEEQLELAEEFFTLAFKENSDGHAIFVIAVIHGSASYLPDILQYMAETYPNLTVKNGLLNKSSDIETTTFSEYNKNVIKHYESGTVRYGPLHQISVVGTAHEEVGGYFPDLLEMLEKNYFLKLTMPWGRLSICKDMKPTESNDGPIVWCRPGEQLVPTADSKTPENVRS